MSHSHIILLLFTLIALSTSLSCQLCMVGSTLMSQSYRVLPHSMAVSLMKAACMKQLDSDKVCESLSKELTPVVLPSVFWRVFNPEVFCGEVGWCPIKYKPLNVSQELERILQVPKLEPLKQSDTPLKSNDKKTYKFLQLSDVHLDIEYKEGYSSICKQTVCCHEENGKSSNASQNAGHYGNYRCDAPESLLDSAVRNIRQLEPQIELVLLTGDLSAHNEWQKSSENNHQIVDKVINKFKDWNVPVLLALGNNECYPDHQFDPTNQTILKANLAESMHRYLTVEEMKTLMSKGYYSKRIQSLGVTIVAMNSLVCDDTNFYLIANVTDPSDQLKWLEQTLLEAEAEQSSVFIISHISPGISGCSHTWTKIYRALSARFSRTIKGHFYGHTHNDQFVVLTNPVTHESIGSIFQAPAISPVSSHEPSFRVYEVDSLTHQIVNYHQYSANLAEGNTNYNGSNDLKWRKTYDFITEYTLPDMSVPSIQSLQTKLSTTQSELNKYRSHMDGGHSAGTGSRGIYCDTIDDRDLQYKCKGITGEDDKMVYFMEMLQGQWLVKV